MLNTVEMRDASTANTSLESVSAACLPPAAVRLFLERTGREARRIVARLLHGVVNEIVHELVHRNDAVTVGINLGKQLPEQLIRHMEWACRPEGRQQLVVLERAARVRVKVAERLDHLLAEVHLVTHEGVRVHPAEFHLRQRLLVRDDAPEPPTEHFGHEHRLPVEPSELHHPVHQLLWLDRAVRRQVEVAKRPLQLVVRQRGRVRSVGCDVDVVLREHYAHPRASQLVELPVVPLEREPEHDGQVVARVHLRRDRVGGREDGHWQPLAHLEVGLHQQVVDAHLTRRRHRGGQRPWRAHLEHERVHRLVAQLEDDSRDARNLPNVGGVEIARKQHRVEHGAVLHREGGQSLQQLRRLLGAGLGLALVFGIARKVRRDEGEPPTRSVLQQRKQPDPVLVRLAAFWIDSVNKLKRSGVDEREFVALEEDATAVFGAQAWPLLVDRAVPVLLKLDFEVLLVVVQLDQREQVGIHGSDDIQQLRLPF
mmetsp:Transcript_27355/g.80105  ORF Transcript_27355/g.80105 Transcript_27355/m.80105 type:complete len:483 (+) Transcript_27355:54-1502(+)